MAKNTAPTTSAPITVGMPQSLGVLAAWPAIYHLFGGRFESAEITAENGLVISGLTMTTNFGVNPETVVEDVNRRERRTQLLPSYLWLDGSAPDHFATANDITQIGVAYFGGDKESGATRQREYFREAAKAYKATRPELSGGRRGPKARKLDLKNLGNVDPSIFQNAHVERADAEALVAAAMAYLNSTPESEAVATGS